MMNTADRSLAVCQMLLKGMLQTESAGAFRMMEAGMLLYVGTDDDYQISGNTVSVKTLDLDCDFTDIAKKLDAIAAGVASPGKRTVENVV